MWLRVGDVDNNGKTYISFWSEFFSYRQYAPYRYAQKGKDKDWLNGYIKYETFDWNLLRKGETISAESLENLAVKIDNFYNNPLRGIGKTIDEIIEECNPVIEK